MKKFKIICNCIALFIINSIQAQQNIALIASDIETSYVSSWENLDAINNGIDPTSSSDKTGGAYGNWNQSTNFNKWNWVQYDFDAFYKIVESDVYWWTDGGGIQIPYASYLQYWDFVNIHGLTWTTKLVLRQINTTHPDSTPL
jgi:hypothetical protein